jgi:catechol 2,3-dioxygenase-like lactoylglutathione lyase family enzyme
MSSTNKKIKGCGFHHVSMRVRDLNKSIRFYTDILGFVERFSWGQDPKRFVLLDTGDGNYFEISQGDPDQVFENGAFHHIALRADDCDAALKVARAAGVEVTVETRDVTLSSEPPLQLRIAFFKGPDGELIELFQDDQT